MASRALRLALWAAVAVFTFDVQVNLGLPWDLPFPDHLAARPRDFLGLFLADSQAALVAVLAALVLGALLARVLPASRSLLAEATPLVPAALASQEILAQLSIAWGLRLPALPLGVAVAAVVGALVWAAMRFAPAFASDEAPGGSRTLRWLIFAPLIVGLSNLGIAGVIKGQGLFAAADLGVMLLWVVVAWRAARARSSVPRAVLHAAPVLVAIGGALAVSALGPWAGSIRASAPRPLAGTDAAPIVLVVLDTVRADHLEIYGYERATMPELAAWSRQALIVRRAVSPAGWTAPAHASIFSGLPVSLHGIHSGGSVFVTSPKDGVRWLPQDLARHGYTSIAVTSNPLAVPEGVVGFDLLVAPQRDAWHASTLGALVDHRSPVLRRVSERLAWRMPHVSAAEVVDLVQRVVPDDRAPHFLFVNLMDAHSPYNPPAAALAALGLHPGRSFGRWRSHRELTSLWESLPPTRAQDLVDLYDAELRAIDNELARLLAWIERRYAGRATVIVTSDHGEELGEEGRVGHEHGLAQRLLHVPLLIRGPTIAAGVRDEITDLRGVHRLILALALGSPPTLDRLLAPDEFGLIAERYPSGFPGGSPRAWVARIEGTLKGVGPSPEALQLFDLSADFSRDEPADPDLAPELLEQIDLYWESQRDHRQELATMTDEEQKRLRSLGYVR